MTKTALETEKRHASATFYMNKMIERYYKISDSAQDEQVKRILLNDLCDEASSFIRVNGTQYGDMGVLVKLSQIASDLLNARINGNLKAS